MHWAAFSEVERREPTFRTSRTVTTWVGVDHAPSPPRDAANTEVVPASSDATHAKRCVELPLAPAFPSQGQSIRSVIRSHQFVREGIKLMHAGHLATLFTARNYISTERNDGALLLLAPVSAWHAVASTPQLRLRAPLAPCMADPASSVSKQVVVL